MSYHGFPIYTQSQDLCDATRCPIKKGPLTVKLEEPFPVITPPVRLLSQAQALCLEQSALVACQALCSSSCWWNIYAELSA